MTQPGESVALPRLRDDLTLHHGGRDGSGADRWVVEDFARNRFFVVGSKQLEILRHWAPIQQAALAERVAGRSGMAVTEDDIAALASFLQRNELVAPEPDATLESFTAKENAKRSNWAYNYISKYFFMKFPLVNPQAFLKATYPIVSVVYSRLFLLFSLIATLTGLFLVFRQFDAFRTSAAELISFEYAGWFVVALVFSKICHELGHGYTAIRYGCRVPSMGVALMVFWPVLYTETSAAWKLKSPAERQLINGAGILTELLIAGYATLLWSFLPPGPAQNAAFYLAVIGWTLSLAVNLNPFMRFDGYYILSDMVGLPNLHQRSSDLARWFLRRYLLGLGDPPPEPMPTRKRRLVVVFGFLLWAYRLVLFLTIALLVYHFFIKVVGLILFAVEIGYLILRPIYGEIKVWWRRRADARLNGRSATGLALVLILIAGVVFPWQSTVGSAGVLTSGQFARVFTRSEGRLTAVHAEAGKAVKAGDVLFELASPKLDLEISQAAAEARVAEIRMRQALLNVRQSDQFQVFGSERQRVARLMTDLQAKASQQTIRAPFDGRVTDVASQLEPGRWLPDRMELALVLGTEGPVVWGYVAESDLQRLSVGASARFFSHTPEMDPIPLTLTAMDVDAAARLPFPGLIAEFGGTIAAEETDNRQFRPVDSYYRVRLDVIDPDFALDRLHYGQVVIDGTRESLFAKAWRQAAAIIVREASF